eukprot:363330-Chlamydomonas_euryale.AAC.15
MAASGLGREGRTQRQSSRDDWIDIALGCAIAYRTWFCTHVECMADVCADSDARLSGQLPHSRISLNCIGLGVCLKAQLAGAPLLQHPRQHLQ